MNAGKVAQCITALAALVGAVTSYRNSRKLKVIQHATNSLTDRLVATTALASEAQGHAKGLEQGREEAK